MCGSCSRTTTSAAGDVLRRVARTTDAVLVVAAGHQASWRHGFLPAPAAGPSSTWRHLKQSSPAPLSDWRLTLGDVELF